MSIPESHPHPEGHEHKGKACPVTGKTHEFCAPQPGDTRSVCPALNTMANHGYINRNGKNLSAFHIARGLKSCYGLTMPFSLFLSYGTFFLLRRIRPVSLYEIGKHNAVEHDASLVHHNTPEGVEYAPIEIDHGLLTELINDVKPGKDESGVDEHQILMDATDVARARVRREKVSDRLDSMHAEIARGEMGIILGVWETKGQNKAGIPVDWLRRWLGEERLPDGWKPTHSEGLFDTVKRSKAIRAAMEKIRKAEANASPATPTPLDEKTTSTTSSEHEKSKL